MNNDMNININIDINMNIDIPPPPPHPMLPPRPLCGRPQHGVGVGGVISIFILISIWILIFISLLIWIIYNKARFGNPKPLLLRFRLAAGTIFSKKRHAFLTKGVFWSKTDIFGKCLSNICQYSSMYCTVYVPTYIYIYIIYIYIYTYVHTIYIYKCIC